MRKGIASLILMAFVTNTLVPQAYAQQALTLVPAGARIELSASFVPPLLKGIKVYPQDPFRLDFILDKGDQAAEYKADASRLIKYFLASLTVPEADLWVNLSPYEKDRIVPEGFGQTEMGRDILAQDYILKQITASVIYPEGEAGKEFWARVYKEAQEKFGTTDIPVDTFNKVWIVPSKATVFESTEAAFVIGSRLKVMLESDYLAESRHPERSEGSQDPLGRADEHVQNNIEILRPAGAQNDVAKQVLREVIIPILEKEVNDGRNFAQLRQVYHSLILATWFKDRIKGTLLGKAYVDRDKTLGIDITDKGEKEKIWAQYVESFKKGVFNFVKEERDAASHEMVPRKYFAGGVPLFKVREVRDLTTDPARLPSDFSKENVGIIAFKGDPVDADGKGWDDAENIPAHWDKDWPIPAEQNFRDAETVMAKTAVSGSLNYQIVRLDRIFQFRDLASPRRDILKALYFKYPNMVAALFLKIASSDHDAWRELLNPSRKGVVDEDMIPSSLIASMFNRTLEIYKAGGKTDFEKEGFSVMAAPEQLIMFLRLFVYLPVERSLEVIRHIKDENFVLFMESLLKDVDITVELWEALGSTLLRFFNEIPEERFIRIAPELSPEGRAKLEKIRGKAFLSMPSSGDGDVVMNKLAQGILEKVLLNQDFPGRAFAERVEADPYFANESPKVLRWLYAACPNITAALFLSFHRGGHGQWKRILNPRDVVAEEDRLESSLIAGMINRALEIHQAKDAPAFEREDFRYVKSDFNSVADLGGLFGYLPEARSLAIIRDIADENLGALLLGMLNFVTSRSGQFDVYKEQIKNIIRKIPAGRLQRAAAKLYSNDRKDLEKIVGGTQAVLPAHWDPGWPVPTLDEIKQAENYLGQIFDGSHVGNRFIVEAVSSETARMLRSLYFKYPDIAAALPIVSTSGSHSSWARILEEDVLEADLVASIMGHAFEIAATQKRVYLEYRGKKFDFNLAIKNTPVMLAAILAYLEPERESEVVGKFKDDVFPLVLQGMLGFVANTSKTYWEDYQEDVRQIIRATAEQRLSKAALKLSFGDKTRLQKVTGKKFITTSTADGRDVVIPRVDQKYVVELESFIQQLRYGDKDDEGRIALGINFNLYAGMEIATNDVLNELGLSGMFWGIFDLRPDIAAAMLASIGGGNHGWWRGILFPKQEGLAGERAQARRAAKLFNEAVNFMRKDTPVDIDGNMYRVLYDKIGMSGLLGYDSEYARHDEVLAMFAEELDSGNVPFFIDGVHRYLKYADYYEVTEDQVGRIEAFIQAIPDIKAVPAPQDDLEKKGTLADTYVQEKMIQVPGRGVGRLVIFRKNPASVDEFLEKAPKGSIVALPTLGSSDTRIGKVLNGIMTFSPGLGAHALFKARDHRIPYVLWPGPSEEFMALEGQIVELIATKDGQVVLKAATQADLEEYERTRPTKIQGHIDIPGANVEDGPFFLKPGDARMKDPREVGFKTALLNILAGFDLSVSDKDISVEVEEGAALPFRLFRHWVESSMYAQQYDAALKRLPYDFVGDHRPIIQELEDLTGKIVDAKSDELFELIKARGEDPADWFRHVFVRCSFNMENPPSMPSIGSGIFKTVANINGREAFKAAIREVYQSLWSEKGYFERTENGILHGDVFPGIWLVKAKDADYSFELQTAPGDKTISLSLAQGLGDNLMSDHPDQLPTRIIIEKTTGEMVGKPGRSTMQTTTVLKEEGGTESLPVDPQKEFLDHPQQARILKALSELARQIEKAVKYQGLLENGFQLEAVIKFSPDGQKAVITLLQAIDLPNDAAERVFTPQEISQIKDTFAYLQTEAQALKQEIDAQGFDEQFRLIDAWLAENGEKTDQDLHQDPARIKAIEEMIEDVTSKVDRIAQLVYAHRMKAKGLVTFSKEGEMRIDAPGHGEGLFYDLDDKIKKVEQVVGIAADLIKMMEQEVPSGSEIVAEVREMKTYFENVFVRGYLDMIQDILDPQRIKDSKTDIKEDFSRESAGLPENIYTRFLLPALSVITAPASSPKGERSFTDDQREQIQRTYFYLQAMARGLQEEIRKQSFDEPLLALKAWLEENGNKTDRQLGQDPHKIDALVQIDEDMIARFKAVAAVVDRYQKKDQGLVTFNETGEMVVDATGVGNDLFYDLDDKLNKIEQILDLFLDTIPALKDAAGPDARIVLKARKMQTVFEEIFVQGYQGMLQDILRPAGIKGSKLDMKEDFSRESAGLPENIYTRFLLPALAVIIPEGDAVQDSSVPDAAELLPSYWDPSWPVPAQKHVDAITEMVGIYSDFKEEPGQAFASTVGFHVEAMTDRVEVLKASFFKYPNLTGLYFLTSFGMHSKWKEILHPLWDSDNEEHIPSGMIAAMMNRALEIYRDPKDVKFENGRTIYGFGTRSLQIAARFLRYLPKERSLSIIKAIDDRNLGLLLAGLLDFIFHSYDGVDQWTAATVSEVIQEIPQERLKAAAIGLDDNNRGLLSRVLGKDITKDDAEIRSDGLLVAYEGYLAAKEFASVPDQLGGDARLARLPAFELTLQDLKERLAKFEEMAKDPQEEWAKRHWPIFLDMFRSGVERLARLHDEQRIFARPARVDAKNNYAFGYSSDDRMIIAEEFEGLAPAFSSAYLVYLAMNFTTDNRYIWDNLQDDIFPETLIDGEDGKTDFLKKLIREQVAVKAAVHEGVDFQAVVNGVMGALKEAPEGGLAAALVDAGDLKTYSTTPEGVQSLLRAKTSSVIYGPWAAIRPFAAAVNDAHDYGDHERRPKIKLMLDREHGLVGVWGVDEALNDLIKATLTAMNISGPVLVNAVAWPQALGFYELDYVYSTEVMINCLKQMITPELKEPLLSYEMFDGITDKLQVRTAAIDLQIKEAHEQNDYPRQQVLDSSNPDRWIVPEMLKMLDKDVLREYVRRNIVEKGLKAQDIRSLMTAVYGNGNGWHDGRKSDLLWDIYLDPRNSPDENDRVVAAFMTEADYRAESVLSKVERAIQSNKADVAHKALRALLMVNVEQEEIVSLVDIMRNAGPYQELVAAYYLAHVELFGVRTESTRAGWGDDLKVQIMKAIGERSANVYFDYLHIDGGYRKGGFASRDIDPAIFNLARALDRYAGYPGEKGDTWRSSVRREIHQSLSKGDLVTMRKILRYFKTLDKDIFEEGWWIREKIVGASWESEAYSKILNALEQRLVEKGMLSRDKDFLDQLPELDEEDVIAVLKQINPDPEPGYYEDVEHMLRLYLALSEKFTANIPQAIRAITDEVDPRDLDFALPEYQALVKGLEAKDDPGTFEAIASLRLKIREQLLAHPVELYALRDADMDEEEDAPVGAAGFSLRARDEALALDHRLHMVGHDVLNRLVNERLPKLKTMDDVKDNVGFLIAAARFIYAEGLGGVDLEQFIYEMEHGDLTYSQLRDLVRALQTEVLKATQKINRNMRFVLPGIIARGYNFTAEWESMVKTEEVQVPYGDHTFPEQQRTAESNQDIEEAVVDKLIRDAGLDVFKSVVTRMQQVLDAGVGQGEDKLLRTNAAPTPADEVVGPIDAQFYRFGQGKDQTAGLLSLLSLWSKKGLNLVRMTREGINVPPGVIVSSQLMTRNDIIHSAAFKAKVLAEIEALKKYSKYPDLKLLLYARSGSAFMLPGLLTTISNVGMNDKEAEELAASTGDVWFAYDTYASFLRSFGMYVLGIDEQHFQDVFNVYTKDKVSGDEMKAVVEKYKKVIEEFGQGRKIPVTMIDQVVMAMEAVYASWDSQGARDYRDKHRISQRWGTVVILQKGVFGNISETKDGRISGVGSASLMTGADGRPVLQGVFRYRGQGDQIMSQADQNTVSLNREGSSLKNGQTFEELNAALYDKVLNEALRLREIFGYDPLIEFVIERGDVWITQSNDEFLSENFPEFADTPEIDPVARGQGLSGGAVRGWVANSIEKAKELSATYERLRAEDPLQVEGIDGVILVINRVIPEMINQIPKGVHILANVLSVHAITLAQDSGISVVAGLPEDQMKFDDSKAAWIIGQQPFMDGDVLSIDGHRNETVYHNSGNIYPGSVPLKAAEKKDVDNAGIATLKVPAGVIVLKGGRKGLTTSGQESEPVELVNEDGTFKDARAGYGEVHEKGLWHMVAHIYLIDPQGRLLLQVRSQDKKTSPGKLQVSISGHVDGGEDPLKAALREAEEEAGFKLEPGKLVNLSGNNGVKRSAPADSGVNNEFATVYVYQMTAEEMSALQGNYNLNEIDAYWGMDLGRFEELMREERGLFAGSVGHLYDNYKLLYQAIRSAAQAQADPSQAVEALIEEAVRAMPSMGALTADWPRLDQIVERLRQQPGVEAIVVCGKTSDYDDIPIGHKITIEGTFGLSAYTLGFDGVGAREAVFIRHVLGNAVIQHVRDGLALVIRQKHKKYVKLSVIDNGRGFLDRNDRPVPIVQAVQFDKSFGVNGKDGIGLTLALRQGADFTLIDEVKQWAVIEKDSKDRGFEIISAGTRVKSHGTAIEGYFLTGPKIFKPFVRYKVRRELSKLQERTVGYARKAIAEALNGGKDKAMAAEKDMAEGDARGHVMLRYNVDVATADTYALLESIYTRYPGKKVRVLDFGSDGKFVRKLITAQHAPIIEDAYALDLETLRRMDLQQQDELDGRPAFVMDTVETGRAPDLVAKYSRDLKFDWIFMNAPDSDGNMQDYFAEIRALAAGNAVVFLRLHRFERQQKKFGEFMQGFSDIGFQLIGIVDTPPRDYPATDFISGDAQDGMIYVFTNDAEADFAEISGGKVTFENPDGFENYSGIPLEKAFTPSEIDELTGLGFTREGLQMEMNDDFRTNKLSIPVDNVFHLLYLEEMKKIIALKRAAGERQIKVIQAGIGKKATEFITFMEIFKQAFEESGISAADGWDIDLVLLDGDREMLGVAYGARQEHETLFRQLPFDLHVRRVVVDMLDREDMQERAATYGTADLVINRNTVYGHEAARFAIFLNVLQAYAQMDRDGRRERRDVNDKRLFNLLSVYLATKNVMAFFCHKGTRYITEPVKAGKVLLVPGARIMTANKKTGLYEVEDPGLMARQGLLSFVNLVETQSFDREKKIVLVVDNRPGPRIIVSRALGGAYDVLEAYHGQEALRLLEAGKVDLVITDRRMPVMGGEELVREMDKRALDIPVIFYTSEEGAELFDLSVNVKNVLHKEFSSEKSILDAVREVLPDAAETGPGGIDLTRGKIPLDVRSAGSGVQFNFDPAMAARFENAAGFRPVILDIHPMTMSLPEFLGVAALS